MITKKPKSPMTNERVNSMVTKIGDVILNNVWDEINDGAKTKKTLNMQLLVRSMVCSIAGLAGDPMGNNVTGYTPEQKNKINSFLTNISSAITSFHDLLDYDNDGVVELVERDADGKVIIGDDIQLMIDDMKKIGESSKGKDGVHNNIMAVISSMYIYFTGENYNESLEDFNTFKIKCEETYNSFNDIKDIDHSKIFSEKKDDIMSFIITLCIISVTVVNITANKIAQINAIEEDSESVTDPANFIITNEYINASIVNVYGFNLDFILKAVDNLVIVFVKNIELKNTGQKIKNFFRKCACCCCKSSTVD
jgi:hypothetical protein